MEITAGYIYIMTHPSFVDEIKIGRSNKPWGRHGHRAWANGQGILPRLAFCTYCNNPLAIEKLIHKRLKEYRTYNQKHREYYDISIYTAVISIMSVIEEYDKNS